LTGLLRPAVPVPAGSAPFSSNSQNHCDEVLTPLSSNPPYTAFLFHSAAQAEHRAKNDHKQIVEVMQTGVAGARVLQTFPASNKLIQTIIRERFSHALR
jgi:hypothetical protein